MKTEKVYQEYNKLVAKQDVEVENLQDELSELKKKYEATGENYKQALKNGQEAKANEMFELQIKLTDDIKKLEQRLKVKMDMIIAVRLEKKKELLLNAKDLKEYYKEDMEKASEALDNAVMAYNKVIEEYSKINQKFQEEQFIYQSIFNSIEDSQRKEFRVANNITVTNWQHPTPAGSPYKVHPNGKLEKAGY